MAEEQQVLRLFDSETGEEIFVCHDLATFERLRDVLRREAQVGATIDVPPTPVRSVSLELAEYTEPTAVGWGARLEAWGCVAILVVVAAVFVVGLLSIIAWLWG